MNKKIIGILSFLPLVYLAIFLSYIFPKLWFTPDNEVNTTILSAFFAIHFLAVVLIFTLIIYYIVKIVKNRDLKYKPLWILAILLIYPILMPYYWLKYIKNE